MVKFILRITYQLYVLISMLLFVLLIQAPQSNVTAISFFSKLKMKICTSKYASRYSLCKYYNAATTLPTTDDVTTAGASQPTTSYESNTSETTDRSIFTSTTTDGSILSAPGREGVTETNSSRQATMNRGPEGLRMKDNTASLLGGSQLACASNCITEQWCLGFAFSELQEACQLMSENILDNGEFINETGWSIYYL